MSAVTRSDVAVRGMKQPAGRGYDERMRHAAARRLRLLVLCGAACSAVVRPPSSTWSATAPPATPVVAHRPTPEPEAAAPEAPEAPWPTYHTARLQGFWTMLPFVLEEDGTKLRAILSGSEYVGETTEGPSILLRPTSPGGSPLEIGVAPGSGFRVKNDGGGDWYDEEGTESLEGRLAANHPPEDELPVLPVPREHYRSAGARNARYHQRLRARRAAITVE